MLSVKQILKIYYPIIFILIIVLLYNALVSSDATNLQDIKADSLTVTLNEFGLEVDTLNEFKDNVKKNQTLADILLPHNISYNSIIILAEKSKDVFDTRKITAGKDYSIYYSEDTAEHVHYFVYEEDPVNYIVFDIGDSVNVYRGKREISLKEREVYGEIENSLWDSFIKLGIDPVLAIELSEIFAWQIDFYTIQSGDKFKAIYEEKYIGDKYVGVGRVYTAWFDHNRKDFYAFMFEQEEGKREYFDENGQSLSKAFLKAPVRFSRISSRFTSRRFHPILKKYRSHYGIDYVASIGTPVQSVGDGRVVESGYKGAEGRYVRVKHNGTYSSMYMHLSKFGQGISEGANVRQGQTIGYVGSSGLSTGPHLDFRFYRNGKPVNYLVQEFPSTHPVKKELEDHYRRKMNALRLRLDSFSIPLNKEVLAAK